MDNWGRDFVVMFLENEAQYELDETPGSFDNLDVELFISTQKPDGAVVTVSTPKLPTLSAEYQITVHFGQPEKVSLPYDVVMSGSVRGAHGIHVTATDDITVYGLNNQHNSADAFLVKPVETLGSDYYAVCYSHLQSFGFTPDANATQLGIVAVSDTTQIHVDLPPGVVVTYDGSSYSSGNTIVLEIDKYDTVQIQSDQDLTGTHVISDKHIAVFSGNRNVHVGQGFSEDHLVIQAPPTDTWGKTFVTAPIPSKGSGDFFRIVASEDNTEIDVSSQPIYNIPSASGFIQISLDSDEHAAIIANKPVLVVQIVKSQFGNEKGDSSMLLIPPLPLYTFGTTFTTPFYSTAGEEFTNFLSVVVDYRARGNVELDGNTISRSGWTKVRDTSPDMAVKLITIDHGTHTIAHRDANVALGVYLYGYFEKLESYAFTAGMLVSKINTVSAIDITFRSFSTY